MSKTITYGTIAICLGFSACVKPLSDPNAVGPLYERWEITVPKPKAQAFGAAMRVLTDSSYMIADASQDAGTIQTRTRKESDVKRGGEQLRTAILGANLPVRLNLIITPQGTDSSRVSIVGEYHMENIDQWQKIHARTGEWRFVQGIGEAIVAVLR